MKQLQSRTVKHLLKKLGLNQLLKKRANSNFSLMEFTEIRKILSHLYIKGSGIEIGPLHQPLPVKKGVIVKYVDKKSRDENISRYPELDGYTIVEPDYKDDGFVLSSIPDFSQYFIIANHVLEHAPSPIHTMIIWSKKLKVNGNMFISVPNFLNPGSFDRGRDLTTIQHMVDDFEICNKGDMGNFHKMNKLHYVEWLNILEPNILKERDRNYVKPSQADIQKRIKFATPEVLSEMHFHTFSDKSFEKFLIYFITNIDKSLKIEKINASDYETLAILKKCNYRDNTETYNTETYLKYANNHSSSVIPLPTGQQSFIYHPVFSPVSSVNPASSKPIGIGSLASGGDTLSVQIGLDQTSALVDICMAYIRRSDILVVNVLSPTGEFSPFTLSEVVNALSTGTPPLGFQPWISSTGGPIDEKLFDIPISSLPKDGYSVYLLLTQAGSLSNYYLWSTNFIVP